MGRRSVTWLQYTRGWDLVPLKCLPALCSYRNHSTILSGVWPPLLSALGKQFLFIELLIVTLEDLLPLPHLGYFLAVGSFMTLLNLGKRIYCQKQESLPAFLVLASNRYLRDKFCLPALSILRAYSPSRYPWGFFF